MIVETLIDTVREWRRRKLNAHDLERINASANRLNAEAGEVLQYQTSDEIPGGES